MLTRTGFGATPHEIEAMLPLTRDQAVDRLLLSLRSRPTTTAPVFTREITPDYWQAGWQGEDNIVVRNNEISQLRAWWIGEMAATPSPFTERLTLFWHGRFVSRYTPTTLTVPLYNQVQTFRSLGSGNYRTLITAMLHDPMMLAYLDNVKNTKEHPNENLARELLELFTLGPGNYSETDIKELARVLAGHHVAQSEGWTYYIDPKAVDRTSKIFLGRRIDGTPEQQIDEVVDTILSQKAASQFLSEKLYREFVSTEIDKQEVSRLAGVFTANHYEIRPLLRAMLTSERFWDPRNQGALIKSPVDLVVGFVRTFQLQLPDTEVLENYTTKLGQTLFDPPTVAGWPGGESWITTGSLLARKKVLQRLWNMADNLQFKDPNPSARGLRLRFSSEYSTVPAKMRVTINGQRTWAYQARYGNLLAQEAASDNPANIKPAWETFFIPEADLPTHIDVVDVSLVDPGADTAAFVDYIDLYGVRTTAWDGQWIQPDDPHCSHEIPAGMFYCAAQMRFSTPFPVNRDDRKAPLNSIIEYATSRTVSPLTHGASTSSPNYTADMLLAGPAFFNKESPVKAYDLALARQLTLDPAYNLK